MAHPRKSSRPITIGARSYRWRIAVNVDTPWFKSVAVYGDGIANGAEIRFGTEVASITPSLIRRVVEFAARRGFAPADRSSSVWLTTDETDQLVYGFPHQLTLGQDRYIWTPDFHGGLHYKIQSATSPEGQLLATMIDLAVEHLSDDVATRFIVAGLQSGWCPHAKGLDCFWLDRDCCQRVIADILTSETIDAP